jgi:uncharacterized protein YkwD
VKILARLLALLALAWSVPALANGNGTGSASEAAAARMQLEDAVLARINFARQHPQAFAEQLRTYRTWFKGNILYLPGDKEGVFLEEGVAAVDEAIAFMERQAPLPALSQAQLLKLAAGDHAGEQGPQGIIGHGSLDGASPGTRVKRRGGGIYVGENISYGFADADEVVRQFIVDDGVPDRGHRHALFSRDYRFAGVGCGPHSVYQYMCVVDMSETRDGSADVAGMLAKAGVDPRQVTQMAWASPGELQVTTRPQGGFQKASYEIPSPASSDAAQPAENEGYEVVEEVVEVYEE